MAVIRTDREEAPRSGLYATLDRYTKKGTGSHGDDNRQDRMDSPLAECEENDVSAYHDNVTVRKVQHLGDTIDHGIAQRNQCVDASQRNPSGQIG